MNNFSEIRRVNRESEMSHLKQHLSQIETPESINLKKPKKNVKKIIGYILIVIIILVVVGVIGWLIKNKNISSSVFSVKTEWQAVFLSDREVYFGKIVGANTEVVTISNVYYLQDIGALQQGENNLNQQKGEIKLIKLGNEIHGPLDEMQINKSQIMFVENLKDDSKMVQAIKAFVTQ